MAANSSHIRASVPEALEGEVVQNIVRLGGTITNIEREGEARTAIRATMPKENVAKLRSWLQSYGDGQGSVSEEPA
jgi:translation elongation factor EF-G